VLVAQMTSAEQSPQPRQRQERSRHSDN
jgi:hypothetical protein